MSRRNGLRKSAFEDEGGEVGLQELDQVTYGMLGAADRNRVVAEARPIKDIYPDLRQPRRAVPSAVRRVAVIDPRSMHTLFRKWQDMAERECNTRPLRLKDMVEGMIEENDADALPEELSPKNFPVTALLLKVVELARDIRENKLINAITVVRTGHTFKLNTGERRWLAYHFLEWLYGSEWSQIPSHETAASVWTQASENLSRVDLGGIALARQFALLVMECYPEQDWGDVENFIEGACDRLYYAQVADGNEWRIPRGMGQKIAAAMAVGETQLRNFRAMLNIPDEIWMQADDEGWSAFAVREWIANENKGRRPPQIQSYTVPEETVSAQNGHTPAPAPTPPTYDTTPYGNTWHEQFQARMAQEKSSPSPALPQSNGAGSQDELPQGYSIKKIDQGNGAASAIANDELTRRYREGSVRRSIQQITEGIDYLLQTQGVSVLSDIPAEERKALIGALVSAMVREIEFCQKLVSTLGHEDALEVEDFFIRVDNTLNDFANSLKNQIARL